MAFFGREKEFEFFRNKLNSNSSELVFVYGRRRIGKTELLKEFCLKEKVDSIFFTCTECSDNMQLENFSSKILSKNISASKYIKKFDDWETAFEILGEFATSEKKSVVIIDEFPYMVWGNHSIPSILQKVWDSVLKNKNILLILCGSAMSFIEKEILAEKNPLYGRATGILKLEQLNFEESSLFFPQYSDFEKVLAYSVLGGVPHYLKQFSNSHTLQENIINTILKTSSVLFSEPQFLLHQELREPAIYNTLIQIIALGNTKFGEICDKAIMEKTKVTSYLKNLMDLRIIHKEFSIDEGNGTQSNGQRGLYKVSDNFFRFWYNFVFPNVSILEQGGENIIFDEIINARLQEFASESYEAICRQIVMKKNLKKELPFLVTKIGRFWNKTDEIDICAYNFDKSKVLLGECKFRKSKCDKNDLKKHFEKSSSIFGKKAEIFTMYFSFSGYTEDSFDYAKDVGMELVENTAK